MAKGESIVRCYVFCFLPIAVFKDYCNQAILNQETKYSAYFSFHCRSRENDVPNMFWLFSACVLRQNGITLILEVRGFSVFYCPRFYNFLISIFADNAGISLGSITPTLPIFAFETPAAIAMAMHCSIEYPLLYP